MLLLLGSDRPRPEPETDEYRQMFEAYRAATQAMAAAGVLIDCAPLQPAVEATSVAVREGETLLAHGPAGEVMTQVGGYTLVECADMDEAVKWAATMPAARAGSVQVRPVIQVSVPA